jgi:hypothetical protein
MKKMLFLILIAVVFSCKKEVPKITGCNIFEYDGRTYDYTYNYGCKTGVESFTIQEEGGPKFSIWCESKHNNNSPGWISCMKSVNVVKE